MYYRDNNGKKINDKENYIKENYGSQNKLNKFTIGIAVFIFLFTILPLVLMYFNIPIGEILTRFIASATIALTVGIFI